MSSDEKRYENRKRCLACDKYGINECPLMCYADVFQIDNCILEHQMVKQLKEGSPEWFMFTNNPISFLCYINYTRKDYLPPVGAKVVTLRSGFGGSAGMTRYIKSIDEKYFTLTNNPRGEGQEYITPIETWYNYFFEL